MVLHLFALLLSAFPGQSTVLSLDDVLTKALQNSETMGIAESELRAARWRFRQAYGALLPTVSLTGRYQRQQIPGGQGSGVSGALRLPSQTNAQITWTQPIFQGLAEYGEVKRLRSLKHASEAGLHAAQIELLSLVSSQYFAIQAVEKDLEHLKRSLELNESRLKELKNREKIGRVKSSEVLVSTSQVAVLKAQILSSEQKRVILRNDLIQSVALSEDFEVEKRAETEEVSSVDLTDWSKKILQRPDVREAQMQEEAAAGQIWSVRSSHFPRLEIGGNYYLKRAGILKDSKWDLALTLSIPIFEGGAAFARVREAVEQRKQAELNYQQLVRQIKIQVQSLITQMNSLKEQQSAYAAAAKASWKSYEAVKKDFDTGLATELDVIQSLNQNVDTQRSLDQVKFQLMDLMQEYRFSTAQNFEEVL